MMTWLLVVYLFVSTEDCKLIPECKDGAIVNRYENAAASYEDCKALGWEKAKALYEQHSGVAGTYSYMCIDKSYQP